MAGAWPGLLGGEGTLCISSSPGKPGKARCSWSEIRRGPGGRPKVAGAPCKKKNPRKAERPLDAIKAFPKTLGHRFAGKKTMAMGVLESRRNGRDAGRVFPGATAPKFRCDMGPFSRAWGRLDGPWASFRIGGRGLRPIPGLVEKWRCWNNPLPRPARASAKGRNCPATTSPWAAARVTASGQVGAERKNGAWALFSNFGINRRFSSLFLG